MSLSIAKKINFKNQDLDPTTKFLRDNKDKISFVEKETEDGLEGEIVINTNIPVSIPNVLPGIVDINPASYSYINFDSFTHYETKKELNIQENSLNPDDAFKFTVNLEYNFLIKTFEDYVKNSSISEYNLPNFYDTINEELIKTPLTPFDSVSFFEIGLKDKYPALPIKKDLYEKSYLGSKLSRELSILLKSFNNDSSPRLENFSLTKYFNQFNPFKEQFPYYTEIFFDNSEVPNTKINFNNIFDEFQIFQDCFMFFDENNKNEVLLQKNTSLTSSNEPPVSSKINFCDLKTFLTQKVTDSTVDPSKINEFKIKIEQIVDTNKINFQKILDGANCYREVVGYKISKFDILTGRSPVALQTWFLPNSKQEKTEFIDTQIIYSKRYKYKISLLVAVVAAKYSYQRNIQQKTLNYKIVPDVKLYEVESSEYQNILLDYPPMEPEVELIPYVGISNKIKINLNTAIGKKLVKPLFFTTEEQNHIKVLAESQDKTIQNIFFQSDEPSDFFELYRLDKEPTNYSDFFIGKKTIIENNDSSAGSFEDEIEQNKKYYYTFRSVDYHNNFSNPSVVYTAELINDNGSIYPLFGFYNFDSDELREASKKFRRFLSFSPSLGNTIFDPSRNEIPETSSKEEVLNLLKIGVNNPAVWDKKFKIRITSLSTGKKIDVNFGFKIKKE